MKKTISLILILTLLIAHTALAVSAFSIDFPISDGLTLVESTTSLEDGSDSHTFELVYTPGRSTFPVVSFGASQFSRKTVSKMASLTDNVVAGVNGDFFSFYTGIPLGAVVCDSRFLSSSVGNNALAVFPDGSLHIGTPDISTKITLDGEAFDFYYNKYPQIYSLYLMDSTYSSSTHSTFDCLEIVLTPDSDVLKLGETVECTVKSVSDGVQNTPIGKGEFVFTVPQTHKAYEKFKAVEAGETLTISVTCSDVWKNALHLIGGGDIIVKDSSFIPETADEYSERVRNARCAVGIRADGSAIFFTVDAKRANYSSGMTLSEVASTLIKKGAHTVMLLDGGGSATVGVRYLGSESFEVINFSSDGYPRAVSNAVLFLNNATPDGIITNASVLSNVYFALPSSRFEITTDFFDASMHQVDEVEIDYSEYSAETEGLLFEGDYLLLDDSPVYERRFTASYTLSDGRVISDEKTVYVPETLDFLSPILEKRVLVPGERTVASVLCEYHGFDVATNLDSFNWYFTENNIPYLREGILAENNVARLYSDGTLEIITDTMFTTATLNVSYGDKRGEVTIYVGVPDKLIDGFEIPDTADTEDAPFDFEYTKGYNSDSALTVNWGTYTYNEPLKVEFAPKEITLMYKGKYNGGGFISFYDKNGDEVVSIYSVKNDFSAINGWTELVAEIPDYIDGEIYIKSPFYTTDFSDATVDNLRAVFGFEGEPFDDISSSWAEKYILNVYMMGLISGYDEGGKTLFAPNRAITRAEFAKLVSGFMTLTPQNTAESISRFADADKIPLWAEDYVAAVAEHGLMTGTSLDDGSVVFNPTSPITRGEVMVVLSRILPDISATPLKFSDAHLVPTWARQGVERVVSSGIIAGYSDNTIRTANNITRAEIAVIISRLDKYLYN